MQMTKKTIECWGKTREKGQRNFIWWYGVIAWGVLMAIIITIKQYFSHESNLLGYFILNIIVFPIVGYAWGYFIWKYMEKKYQQAKAQENSN